MEQVLPGVIIDGAHNEAGVEEFVKTARRLEADDPVTLLFAAVGDKDYRHMIETICRELRLERVIVTEVGGCLLYTSRALPGYHRKDRDSAPGGP